MASEGKHRGWPGPEYVTRRTFRAPLPFVFDWCTDYSPRDPKLENEQYVRRVLQRTRRKVVFEDLQGTEAGWFWARYYVSLKPPNGWHMRSVGNTRCLVGDYTLSRLPGNRTGFELRYRRRPGLVEFERVSKSARSREDARTWRRFARALESDYAKSVGTRTRRPRAPSGRRRRMRE